MVCTLSDLGVKDSSSAQHNIASGTTNTALKDEPCNTAHLNKYKQRATSQELLEAVPSIPKYQEHGINTIVFTVLTFKGLISPTLLCDLIQKPSSFFLML